MYQSNIFIYTDIKWRYTNALINQTYFSCRIHISVDQAARILQGRYAKDNDKQETRCIQVNNDPSREFNILFTLPKHRE